MKPLVIIPARGGSKGVPRKNIKKLGGKPLILYTIEAARSVFRDEQICVSTDDLEIKAIVEEAGLKVPFLRPDELSTDTVGTYEVLLHAINFYENQGEKFDTIILLQATSPFRTATHIREALAIYDKSCEMLVSVKETKANPYYNLREENEEGWLVKSKSGDFTRRQDCPEVYEVNGAIYIIKLDILKQKPLAKFTKVRKYIMEEKYSCDVDTELDFDFCEFLIKKNK
ncbi:MAG: cytidylyltransferase domain-containing protein [bacterium]